MMLTLTFALAGATLSSVEPFSFYDTVTYPTSNYSFVEALNFYNFEDFI